MVFASVGVQGPILSLGMLERLGHRVFIGTCPHIQTNTGATLVLPRFGNQFLHPARVAPVTTTSSKSLQNMLALVVAPADEHSRLLEQVESVQPGASVEDFADVARGERIPELTDVETVSARLPPAPWCDMCISPRGRDAPRRESRRLAAVIPGVQLDHYSPGAGQGVVIIDRATGDIFARG